MTECVFLCVSTQVLLLQGTSMLITMNAESTVFVSQHIAIRLWNAVSVCGPTQIHLAAQYGRHFVDEHLMQFKCESSRLL